MGPLRCVSTGRGQETERPRGCRLPQPQGPPDPSWALGTGFLDWFFFLKRENFSSTHLIACNPLHRRLVEKRESPGLQVEKGSRASCPGALAPAGGRSGFESCQPLTHHVTIGKWLPPSQPLIPHLQNETTVPTAWLL